MLNTTEIELIHNLIIDYGDQLTKINCPKSADVFYRLADGFIDNISADTDDSELEREYNDSCQEEIIEAIETTHLKEISEDLYNHLSTLLSKNIVTKEGYVTNINLLGYSVQFIPCTDTTVDVFVETRTKPTIGVKYNYQLHDVLIFDNIKVRKIICSVHGINRP